MLKRPTSMLTWSHMQPHYQGNGWPHKLERLLILNLIQILIEGNYLMDNDDVVAQSFIHIIHN